MISVFGYNLGIVLEYPTDQQNYTFSRITVEDLLKILESGNFRNDQTFYLAAKPNKAFTDLAKQLLSDESITSQYITIHFVYDHEAACKEGFKKLNRKFKKRATAGGIVENADGAFLAIYVRDRWALPKGGIEPDESPQEAAVREVEEETGLLLPTVIGGLPNSYHVYPFKGDFILKTTYWFLMHVENPTKLVPQEDEGITDVRWFYPKEWIEENPPTYPQTRAYLQQYFSQQLIGE